jgi:hypothetical protein
MSAAQLGGGKYQAELDALMASTKGDAVLLIVKDGNRGSGFSIGVNVEHDMESALADVPSLLRAIADSIEEQQRGAN